ncbi:MAG: hypothetical protein V3V99_02320 [candidate division Zixibacteria bacterium]
MNWRHPVIILSAVVVLCGNIYATGEIEITASVDKQTAFIGDLIEYTISVAYDSTIVLTPPAVGANLGQFDVKDYKAGEEEKLEDGRLRQTLWFSMRTFTTGEYIIPPLPIEYMMPDSTKRVLSSDPIKINIKSVLGEGAQTDTLRLVDIRGQVSIPGDNTVLIWSIFGAVIFVSGGIFALWWFKWRKREEEEYIDPRPAWEIAFADLAELKDKNLPEKGELKLFYIELTEIIRRFVGKKFEFDAIDLTTSEIKEKLNELSVDENYTKEFTEFLEQADLIKFAKFIPPTEQPVTDWQTTFSLIDRGRDLTYTLPEHETPDIYIPSYQGIQDEEFGELKYAPPELRAVLAANSASDENKEDAE